MLYGELRMMLGGATSIAGSISSVDASGLMRSLDPLCAGDRARLLAHGHIAAGQLSAPFDVEGAQTDVVTVTATLGTRSAADVDLSTCTVEIFFDGADTTMGNIDTITLNAVPLARATCT